MNADLTVNEIEEINNVDFVQQQQQQLDWSKKYNFRVPTRYHLQMIN